MLISIPIVGNQVTDALLYLSDVMKIDFREGVKHE
jgi:hypothetical protein